MRIVKLLGHYHVLWRIYKPETVWMKRKISQAIKVKVGGTQEIEGEFHKKQNGNHNGHLCKYRIVLHHYITSTGMLKVQDSIMSVAIKC